MRKLGSLFSAALLSFVLFVAPTHAFAMPNAYLADTPQQQICSGVGLANTSGTGSTNSCGDQGLQVSNVIKTVINLLSFLVGVLSVIMIIVSGFRFITSGGDSSKVTSAKNTLIYALIGVVVVILSQALVLFVLNTVPH